MKRAIARGVGAVALTALAVTGAVAGPDEDQLVINEEIEIVTEAAAPAHLENLDTIYSGWRFRKDETQAAQADDFENPAFIFVETAIDAFNTVEGAAEKSCASCHGSPDDMAGIKPTYPKWNEGAGEVRSLEMQVNACREEQMQAEAWKYTGKDMTNMIALLSSVSRGMPVNVAIDGPAQSTWEKGKEMYYTRYGQLELSCANCHEDNYGNMIRADHLSQGQINGFPAYRLKNTKLNTVHDRFKGCIRDTRAETFSPSSADLVALELYVTSRANGLSVEGPSVRN